MTESEAWRVCRFEDKRTAELIHPKRAQRSRTANWPDSVWLFCRRNSIDGVERIDSVDSIDGVERWEGHHLFEMRIKTKQQGFTNIRGGKRKIELAKLVNVWIREAADKFSIQI